MASDAPAPCALRLAAAGAAVRAVDRDELGLADPASALPDDTPGSIAPQLLDLTPQASFIRGASLVMDGGWTAHEG
ncbi:hypothetical protein SNA_15705 [Streptomyces natalensis ATCC 27448]|uniref:Short-chain dehydrogenase n=1 Tax=Streptomyces natalensis ATCC 27448 TaxID=1240678 RepID=A0A0D7CNS8_9ACTN|nr:hypothetical protein SNA_15705 [Streptomyces natalensis ATCC 27448]